MSRMVPLAGIASYVVTADDGTLFHCQAHRIHGEEDDRGDEPGEARWVFIDTSRVRYVGPVYEGHIDARRLQRMLSDWWRSHRSNQLAGTSGQTSHDTTEF